MRHAVNMHDLRCGRW